MQLILEIFQDWVKKTPLVVKKKVVTTTSGYFFISSTTHGIVSLPGIISRLLWLFDDVEFMFFVHLYVNAYIYILYKS